MPANNARVLDVIRSIDGLITDWDALALYHSAKKLSPDAVVVEIGSFKGKSTVCLALGLKDAGNQTARLYAIDPFEGKYREDVAPTPSFEDFKENVAAAGLNEFVVPLRMTSEEAARKWGGDAIDLLFVDGAHDYAHAKQDLLLWTPFLSEGGLLLVDDYGIRGVASAFHEAVVDSPAFSQVSVSHWLARARKERCTGLAQALKRGLFYARQAVRRLLA